MLLIGFPPLILICSNFLISNALWGIYVIEMRKNCDSLKFMLLGFLSRNMSLLLIDSIFSFLNAGCSNSEEGKVEKKEYDVHHILS